MRHNSSSVLSCSSQAPAASTFNQQNSKLCFIPPLWFIFVPTMVFCSSYAVMACRRILINDKNTEVLLQDVHFKTQAYVKQFV
jgi:hypothetical protein